MSGDSVYRPGMKKIVLPQKGRRGRGRLRVDELCASVGPVLDLSPTGMRTIVSKVKKDTFPIEIHTAEGIIRVEGHIAWSRKISFRTHEVGIEFVGVTDETSKLLATIAMENRSQRAAG